MVLSIAGEGGRDSVIAWRSGRTQPPPDVPPPYPHDYSPDNVRANVEQSLRRLRTDRLDLVQDHRGGGQGRGHEAASLDDLLTGAGLSPMEFTLRFTLSNPGLSSTIVGTSSPAHLRANIAVAERGPLPADLYEEAKRRLLPPGA